jgi:uncharacterized protein YndB with AHSA1/START domain
MEERAMAVQPAETEKVLVITRTIEAPRELVWQAFSDPFHLSQWWGPTGFTNPVCDLDFRVGGHWHHVMRGPDGSEYPTDSMFIEIVPPERIVYRNAAPKGEVWGDNPPPSFLRTITFADEGGRTTLTIRAEFDTAEDQQAAARRGWIEGTEQSLDKLAALLTPEHRRT